MSLVSSAISALAIPLLAAAMMGAAMPTRAATISYGTGLASPAFTLNFDGLADGSTVGSTYAAQGVTFGGLFVTTALGNTLAPTTAPAAANFQGATTNSVFTISFTTAVSDAAFFLYTDGFGTTITSSLAGNSVGSVSAGGYHTDGADFFGFTGSLFDKITIAVAGSGTAVIDNVQVGVTAQAVPEPSSMLVVMAGVTGLLMTGRRRR